MIRVRAGELNVPIEIHSKTTTGTGGFKITTFAKVLDAWAKVVFTQNMESSGKVGETVAKTATVTMHYDALVKASSQVVIAGETFKIITDVENVEMRNQWIQFKVRQVVPA